MMLADVNIYVNAFRPDAEQHLSCRTWLDRLNDGDSAFGVSPQVLSSFIRIATHRRIFRTPSPLTEVLGFCRLLIEHPNARLIQPGERHWAIFERLCIAANAKDDLVPDAWFAALAIEHGCDWITLDRDFSRFSGLKWRAPD
jgi:uncharacterized protein